MISGDDLRRLCMDTTPLPPTMAVIDALSALSKMIILNTNDLFPLLPVLRRTFKTPHTLLTSAAPFPWQYSMMTARQAVLPRAPGPHAMAVHGGAGAPLPSLKGHVCLLSSVRLLITVGFTPETFTSSTEPATTFAGSRVHDAPTTAAIGSLEMSRADVPVWPVPAFEPARGPVALSPVAGPPIRGTVAAAGATYLFTPKHEASVAPAAFVFAQYAPSRTLQASDFASAVHAAVSHVDFASANGQAAAAGAERAATASSATPSRGKEGIVYCGQPVVGFASTEILSRKWFHGP